MTTAGSIPLSPALSEASPDSLSELFSRDPEGFQRQDRDAIVKALRAQRQRLRDAEAAGGLARSKKVAAGKAETAKAAGSSEDLGF